MPLTQTQIKQLSAKNKKYNKGCGDGLYIRVEPIRLKKDGSIGGGGKSFWGEYQRKPVTIGKFDPNNGGYSLEQARTEWYKIKEWSKVNNKHPKEYYKRDEISTTITFRDTVDVFLTEMKLHIKETTLKEYRNKLHNTILPLLDGDTPITSLEDDNGGRKLVMDVINTIEDGRKYDLGHRCRYLIKQCFEQAEIRGWVRRNQNPATKLKGEKKRHKKTHHHTIKWDQVPDLLHSINMNKCSSHIQTVLQTKLLLMTFLRTGALARLKWDWFTEIDGIKCIVIPASTSGLKRKKNGDNANEPHHVPITKEMDQLFSYLRELNGSQEYVFQAIKNNKIPHADPLAPNNFLKALNYRGKLRAHGWRAVALTYGQEVLKTNWEIIDRQMGHLPQKKGERGHYDNSIKLEERKDFLDKWCKALVDQGLKI